VKTVVGKRVLVVDDDNTIRELIVMALLDSGYEPLVARHGAEALAVLEQTPADLILLDMRMPVMDGGEFVRAYRARPGPHAPVVVLSADRSAASTSVGAVARLVKPFELDQLLATIADAIDSNHTVA
jgi:CheY-like chemotaxis protein